MLLISARHFAHSFDKCMAAQPLLLGDIIADDIIVFRAFAYEGFRKRKSNKVRAKAFERSCKKHPDGLSLGLTPQACVMGLSENHGYCRILVGEIHSLNHGVQVRVDEETEGHVLICNMPCTDGTDQERELGTWMSAELARLAKPVTCEPYTT
jgi:hypothetical protein